MATKYGTLPASGVIQPGSELIYHDTGFLEGSLIVRADEADAPKLYVMIGKKHPTEDSAFLYAMRLRHDASKLVTATFDVAGIQRDFGNTTKRVFSIVPAQELVPIEAHLKFLTGDMAGPESGLTQCGGAALTSLDTVGEGENGARFSVNDKHVTGFLGFLGPEAPAELRGVRSYQRNNPVLRATWYTYETPKFEFKSVIVTHPKDAPEFEGVKDWLRASPVGEPVGSLASRVLWKNTQEYIGSEDGWSRITYGDPVEE